MKTGIREKLQWANKLGVQLPVPTRLFQQLARKHFVTNKINLQSENNLQSGLQVK